MLLKKRAQALGKKEAYHFLSRTIGWKDSDLVDFALGKTADQLFEVIYANEAFDLPQPILKENFQQWVGEPFDGDFNGNGARFDSFKIWFLHHLAGAHYEGIEKAQLAARERIVLFIHTHLTARWDQIESAEAIFHQNRLFRKFAFDSYLIRTEENEEYEPSYKKLVEKICIDNAMLRMLDGRLNVRGNPNENFARELFELYTTGRGLETVDKGNLAEGDYLFFTEQDIQEAARVLSGFNFDDTFSQIDPDTNLPEGILRGGEIATQHDNGVKRFSPRLGGAVIEPDPELLQNGQATLASVKDEIRQLIDLIFDQQETAQHICRRIFRFFMHYQVDENIENTVIAEMTATFKESGYKILPVIKQLTTSTYFFGETREETIARKGGIIKSPLELALGTIRQLELPLAHYESAHNEVLGRLEPILRFMNRTGMDFYNPFDVNGYDAYHQFPIFNRSWITTNYLVSRYSFIDQTIGRNDMEGLNLIEITRKIVPAAIAPDARQLVIFLAEYLLPLAVNLSFEEDTTASITAMRMNYFLEAFLKNPQIDDNPEAAWNTRWTRNLDPETVNGQLRNLYNALMQSPEYQLI
ncbi:MAG: DUF1800 domain-containing protein [Cyclobacteriaceae bacterium]|nr:DUF1800 family protein [Cyclobacteriaceae bacterium]MCH8515995.1 DUF1800 domain-containing protein [Cyclobacteriaceae bacterium]